MGDLPEPNIKTTKKHADHVILGWVGDVEREGVEYSEGNGPGVWANASVLETPQCLLQLTHHLPLCTDVRSWSQDDQQFCFRRLIQKGNEVPAAIKVIDPWLWLMVVPGHITEKRRG